MKQLPHSHSTLSPLRRLISEWRALAQEQGEAIRRSDWRGLIQLGDTKESLKKLIDSTIATLGSLRDELQQELRLDIEELTRLEQQNSQLLAECCHQSAAALEQSQTEVQRLRSIRNAYTHTHRTGWHSYS